MASDAPSQLQGSDAAVMEWVCQGCGTHNADPTMLSHPKLGEDGARCHGPVVAVEYVPLSVAENLATALRELIEASRRMGIPRPTRSQLVDRKARLERARQAADQALAAYPREETE